MSVDGLLVFSKIFAEGALVVVDSRQITLYSLPVVFHCQMVLSFSGFVLRLGFETTYFTGTAGGPKIPILTFFTLLYML